MTIRVLESRPFARWAKSEQLADKALCAAVREIESGLIDARLGGFLLKKRIAKDHRGKSGGLRTIVAHRQGKRLIFLFGFAKRERENIDHDEKEALHKLGEIYMSKSDLQINKLIKERVLLEVHCNDEE